MINITVNNAVVYKVLGLYILFSGLSTGLKKKKKKPHLEIWQRTRLGAQRLSILIGFSPLDCFISRKLRKGQTEKTKMRLHMFTIKCEDLNLTSWSYVDVVIALTCGWSQSGPSLCSSL